MKNKKKKRDFDIEDYIKINKALLRKEELERNGGRWKAVNRPHKNKKKYDRKRDSRVDFDYPNFYIKMCMLIFNNFVNSI